MIGLCNGTVFHTIFWRVRPCAYSSLALVILSDSPGCAQVPEMKHALCAQTGWMYYMIITISG